LKNWTRKFQMTLKWKPSVKRKLRDQRKAILKQYLNLLFMLRQPHRIQKILKILFSIKFKISMLLQIIKIFNWYPKSIIRCWIKPLMVKKIQKMISKINLIKGPYLLISNLSTPFLKTKSKSCTKNKMMKKLIEFARIKNTKWICLQGSDLFSKVLKISAIHQV